MNAQIYEQATEWVIRQRDVGLDAQDKRAFDAWLRASPQHVQAYLEMCALWEDLPLLEATWNPSADELIARARADDNVVQLVAPTATGAPISDNRIGGATADVSLLHEPASSETHASDRATTVVSGRRMTLMFALAASILLAVVGGWFYLQQGMYATGIGEQRSLVLADGSTVELNSGSRIRIRYSEHERHIDLIQGQALFHVARNAARPFVVQTNSTRVKAVGTAFDVYQATKGTVVTVVEGRVAVYRRQSGPGTRTPAQRSGGSGAGVDAATTPSDATPPSSARGAGSAVPAPADLEEILLGAGEQLIVTPVAVPSPQRADVAAATAWTQRSLVFDSSPLTEVAHEFNRYNTRQLVIVDPRLADFHVSGVFSSAEPTLLLRFLRDQPNLALQETPTEIRIYEK